MKCWLGWITSRNQDYWEKYQEPQICRWHHPYGRKWRGTKKPFDKSERGEWKSCPQVPLYLCKLTQMVKNLPAMWETQVWSLGWEEPLEKEMTTHCSILARRIPWTEELGRLQSMGLQRVGHDWATNTHTHTHTHIRVYGSLWVTQVSIQFT